MYAVYASCKPWSKYTSEINSFSSFAPNNDDDDDDNDDDDDDNDDDDGHDDDSESCVEARRKGGTVSGAYSLFPDGLDAQPFWCDMENGGGGWLVSFSIHFCSVD